MKITELDFNKVKVECKEGFASIYWAPNESHKAGGYVRLITNEKPGIFGFQITWKNGATVEWDGKSPLIQLIRKVMKQNTFYFND